MFTLEINKDKKFASNDSDKGRELSFNNIRNGNQI